jgi:hypothetical protein
MRLIAIVLALMTLTTLLMIQEGRIMAQNFEIAKGDIPPVDRDIPENIETATFALG